MFVGISAQTKKSFLIKLKKRLNCEVEGLDFLNKPNESCCIINNWAENQTAGIIKQLLPPGAVTANTRIVLANAIYLKGLWARPFHSGETKAKEFYCADKSISEVKMMRTLDDYKVMYDQNLKLHCLQIPYEGNEISMCIFLPDSRFGLAEVEQKLSSEKMNELINECRTREVALALPKFCIEFEKDLVDTLQALGIVDVFNDSKSALTRLSDKARLHVSSVAHKAYIEVNEEGTKAAAVTPTMVCEPLCRVNPLFEFNCNHPFVFVIRHNETKQFLFLGKFAFPN